MIGFLSETSRFILSLVIGGIIIYAIIILSKIRDHYNRQEKKDIFITMLCTIASILCAYAFICLMGIAV